MVLSWYDIVQMCFNAFDAAADLDVLDHPVLNFIYYLVCFHICYILQVLLLNVFLFVVILACFGSSLAPFPARHDEVGLFFFFGLCASLHDVIGKIAPLFVIND